MFQTRYGAICFGIDPVERLGRLPAWLGEVAAQAAVYYVHQRASGQ